MTQTNERVNYTTRTGILITCCGNPSARLVDLTPDSLKVTNVRGFWGGGCKQSRSGVKRAPYFTPFKRKERSKRSKSCFAKI